MQSKEKQLANFREEISKLDSESGFEKCIALKSELIDAQAQIKNLEISLESKTKSYQTVIEKIQKEQKQSEKLTQEEQDQAEQELREKENELKRSPTFN